MFLLIATVRVGKAGRRMYNAGFLGSGAVACIGWFLAFASRWVSDSLTFYISAVGIVAVADVLWAVLVATLAWLPADESIEHRLTVYRRQFLVLLVALAGARASEAWLAPPRLMLIFEAITCCAEVAHAACMLVWHTPTGGDYKPLPTAGGPLIDEPEEED